MRCGLNALVVPSTQFLDWEVSHVDDRVMICPDCASTGQPALDAVNSAVHELAGTPHTFADNIFEDPIAREEARTALGSSGWSSPN